MQQTALQQASQHGLQHAFLGTLMTLHCIQGLTKAQGLCFVLPLALCSQQGVVTFCEGF